MKFRFQINGTIEAPMSNVPTIQSHLTDILQGQEIKISGMAVHELPEKKRRKR